MKIIFLDHDGVICLRHNWGSRFKKSNRSRYSTVADSNLPTQEKFDDFDQSAIKTLNSIIEKTGAEIVVSSDWQNFASCEELGEYYESQGIVKRPIGVTKEVDGIDLEKYDKMPWNWLEDSEQHRSLEILEWLSIHPEVTHWVAVDDLDMSARYGEISGDLKWGLSNFVLIKSTVKGITQDGVTEDILNFLL